MSVGLKITPLLLCWRRTTLLMMLLCAAATAAAAAPPRSHVSFCQVTRPDKVAIVKDTDALMYSSIFILRTHYSSAL